MTLETLYYVSQIAAVLAILASLIFVGVQIRQNTQQSKAAAIDASHRTFVEWYYSQSPEKAAVFARATKDFDSLSAEDRYLFFAISMPFLMNLQEAHAKHEEGALVADRWRLWDRFASTVAISSAITSVWEQRRYLFSDSFQSYFDTKIENREAIPQSAASWVVPNEIAGSKFEEE